MTVERLGFGKNAHSLFVIMQINQKPLFPKVGKPLTSLIHHLNEYGIACLSGWLTTHAFTCNLRVTKSVSTIFFFSRASHI
jgi:hypothetical protein